MNAYTSNEETSLDIMQAEINALKMQNDSKDEYIKKLEEKTEMMQKYIIQLEKENMTKAELGKNIIKTKEEFDKLRLALGEKYAKLEMKYERLKARCAHSSNNNNNYPTNEYHMNVPHTNYNSTAGQGTNMNYQHEKRGHNAKIDKCIEKINNLVTEMNKENK